MQYLQLLELFRQNGDESKIPSKRKIINTELKMFGCNIPFVRNASQLVTLDEAERYPVHDYFEVDLLRSVKVADIRLPSLLLAQFADTIENWAVCDVPVRLGKDKERYFAFFCDMLSSDQPFVCRYGVVNLLGKFLDEQHIGDVFARLGDITQWGHYYVDMGAAWLVATAMAHCRNQTVAFMEGDGRKILPGSAYNKALQKMRDSFRIQPDDKQWTHTIKMV